VYSTIVEATGEATGWQGRKDSREKRKLRVAKKRGVYVSMKEEKCMEAEIYKHNTCKGVVREKEIKLRDEEREEKREGPNKGQPRWPK
jgi:hypothetical protein